MTDVSERHVNNLKGDISHPRGRYRFVPTVVRRKKHFLQKQEVVLLALT
jgi:hypothetical protein